MPAAQLLSIPMVKSRREFSKYVGEAFLRRTGQLSKVNHGSTDLYRILKIAKASCSGVLTLERRMLLRKDTRKGGLYVSFKSRLGLGEESRKMKAPYTV